MSRDKEFELQETGFTPYTLKSDNFYTVQNESKSVKK